MSDDAKIRKFLIEVQKINPVAAEDLLDLYKNHPDIYNEVLHYIQTGEYIEDGAKSANYTAKSLSEKLPHLPPQIIFEFMVGLRDKSEAYQKYVDEGAPIKD
jgi:hypothetical protein